MRITRYGIPPAPAAAVVRPARGGRAAQSTCDGVTCDGVTCDGGLT